MACIKSIFHRGIVKSHDSVSLPNAQHGHMGPSGAQGRGPPVVVMVGFRAVRGRSVSCLNWATPRRTLRTLVHMKRPLRFRLGHGLSRTAWITGDRGTVTVSLSEAINHQPLCLLSYCHPQCDPLQCVLSCSGTMRPSSFTHCIQVTPFMPPVQPQPKRCKFTTE